ncbi:MAG: tetratricopeptide repeat protein [Pseudomonadota bacterium]|nr:tetratricopeptide repeat protein [Pseudomonadota bacterium]
MLLIFFLPISLEAVAPKTYGEFIGWYERTANGGSLQTQYLLGYMYKTGKGRTKDLKAAKKWFGKAANNGHSLSQLQLAKLLLKDSAVEGNLTLALKWLKKASKKNIAEASFHLARFYERGLIVKKNKSKSLELYEKAAISGISAAQFNLGLLMATSKEYDRDRLISSWAWLSLALENGVLNSEKALAQITKYLSPIERDKGTRLLEQIRNLTNE